MEHQRRRSSDPLGQPSVARPVVGRDEKTFELDELGKFVWDACDAKTSVRQIIRKLAKRYNLNDREAEVATVAFLKTLTSKGLIGMAV